MIYVFTGGDDFSIAQAVEGLLETVGPEELRESNVARMDGAGLTVEAFGATAMVAPFLSDRRLVIVRGLLAAAEGTGKRGRRGAKSVAEERENPALKIAPLLAQLPPTTDVVLWDEGADTGNPLLAAVKALGPEAATVRSFITPRGEQLTAWITQRAGAKGARIEPRAATHLAEVGGASLWGLDSALDKLAIYAGDEPIGVNDVDELVPGERETSVFELVDALMGRQADRALDALDRLLRAGASAAQLLATVNTQVRRLALAQELAAQGVPQSGWGQHMGTSSDFALRKVGEQARRFSPEAVRALYGMLLEADLALKSGSTDELTLAELAARTSLLPAPARR
ncbi:MAG: DNA polymerase III subunit delta [Chloroflexota bacterium]